MEIPTLDARIEVTPGVLSGRPRIAGRRIGVHHVALWHERQGLSAEEIAGEHDLSLADVYAALAYYHAHREEVDRALREEEAFVAAFEREHPSRLTRSRGV